MFRAPLLVLLVLFAGSAAAQSPDDDEYYPYAGREERRELLTTDSTLFYRAIQTARDLYGAASDFALPRVAQRRRGLPYDEELARLGQTEVSYRYFPTLRLLGAEEHIFPGATPAETELGGAGGTREFRFPDGEPLLPYLASVRFSDRNYRVGAKAAASLRRGPWSLALAFDARTGRDLLIEGVFTHALTGGFRLSRSFASGARASLLFLLPVSMQGTRLSSSAEAFSLTDDPYYNPAWGYQSGRVRNSRVRREILPLAVADLAVPLSAHTELRAGLSSEAGVLRYSMLDWFDARTPMPDNYRYLPSHTGDRETRDAWLADDPRYTQIDWDALIRRNRLSADGDATYALSDRVERRTDLTLSAVLVTRPDPRLTLRLGAVLRADRSRFHKQMRDLLGASHLTDIDQYLIDDDTYGNLLQNDLRHPDRKVRTGDRFGYDYALLRRDLRILFRAVYRSDRLHAEAGAELGRTTVRRRGYYEKELFPGTLSFGPSRRLHFTPYRFKLLVGWSFTPRSYLSLTAFAGSSAPLSEALFYQPLYNNRTVADPRPERIRSAELTFRRTGRDVELQLTAFATLRLDGSETRRCYDDLAALYCDLAVSGIGQSLCGVELGASLRLSYRWRLALAASAARYAYVRDPRVTLLSDVDNTEILTRSVSRMGGCRVGGAPQLTSSAELTYFGPRGWSCHLSAGYAGSRYAEPSVLRRTDRVTQQAGITPELFRALTLQERLPDAFTLDASLFRTFYFGRSRLTAGLMLRNLTGDRTLYAVYESNRLRRIPAGDAVFYEPHASRCSHAWPRSFYVTVSYRF